MERRHVLRVTRTAPGRTAATIVAAVTAGVDISPGMLQRARRRLDTHSITNVELVEADIASYQPPPDTSAVVATFAIEMAPTYDEIIRQLAATLPVGGRIVTTGLRDPDGWPEWLIRLASDLNRLLGVSQHYRDHRPWESVHRYTTDTVYLESHAGAVYLAAGTTRPGRHPPS